MNNSDVLNKLRGLNFGYIKQLFWIACSLSNKEFYKLIGKLTIKELYQLFPEFSNSESKNVLMNCIVQDDYSELFVLSNKLGFLAEITAPVVHSPQLIEKDGISMAKMSITNYNTFIIYSETIEELYNKIVSEFER